MVIVAQAKLYFYNTTVWASVLQICASGLKWTFELWKVNTKIPMPTHWKEPIFCEWPQWVTCCPCRDTLTLENIKEFPEDSETEAQPALVVVRSCPAEWEECWSWSETDKGSFVSVCLSLTWSYLLPSTTTIKQLMSPIKELFHPSHKT